MSKSWKSIFTLIISFCFLLLFTPKTFAETPDNAFTSGECNGAELVNFAPVQWEKGFWKKLTKEQKKILRNAIKELKEKGATRKEIRELIKQYLEEWGIKPGKKKRKAFWEKLTKEQRKELRQAIKELKKQGAFKEEIRALIKQYLEKWGIKPGK